jgi:hypothetical protein
MKAALVVVAALRNRWHLLLAPPQIVGPRCAVVARPAGIAEGILRAVAHMV